MFKLLSPEETGIVTENKYADPEMWAERYQEFALGEIGTGIAIGDYDGDGRPDIFVVSKTEGCRLFRNLGNWKFEDVTERAGLARASGTWDKAMSWAKSLGGKGDSAGDDARIWKQGATFVDVNNDGLLDIYLCRFGAPNLLYINQGNGTFKEEAAARGLAVADASGMAAFCDYDRDGWLDVFIHTNMLDAAKRPNGQRDYLFHNNGDGTFSNVTDRAGISGETLAHSATWWDYNNDGWPDIYVANDFGPVDHLYHNNHDGTFTEVLKEVVPHIPYSSMGADLGDVNNDGLIDFFVADMATTTHEKDQRGMASSRELSRTENEKSLGPPQYVRNALFLNTGTGRCLEAAQLAGIAATDWTWSVRFEDLDNDGRLDLHVTNGMNREHQNSDLRERVVVAESLAERMRLMRESPVLAEKHLAFRNLGDLQFEDVSAAWGLDQKAVSFGAAFGDLDGDGDLDLVYANYEQGVTVLRNDCDTGHRVVFALRGKKSNRFGVGATVRIETETGVQVRQLVLARGYLSSSEPVLHFGLGTDSRLKRVTVSWPSGYTQTFNDLAVDRRYTVTEPSTGAAVADTFARAPSAHALYREVGGELRLSFNAREVPATETAQDLLVPTRHSRLGPAIAIGDLNGDGSDDVVIGGTSAEAPRVLLRDGSGFSPGDANALASNVPTTDGPILLFDANGDGANDVLLTRAGENFPSGASEYQPRLLLNDGHGHFRAAPLDSIPALPISVGAVAAADFDRDGQLDVFVGGRVQPGHYPLSPQSALLLNRNGKFEDATDRVAPALRSVGMVTSAVWSDVDGDGWMDLLVATEWGYVRYFHSVHGTAFEDWTDKAGFGSAGSGWWTSIAAADFNGDGRPDYVVGNVGLNTQYHGTTEHPALLFYGPLAPGTPPQNLEACYEGDRLFPWRTRKELGAKAPSILKKFPKNDGYAVATVEQIIGSERLAKMQRFPATELRSGVFLSQPGGAYHFEPLPRIAQVAPLQGIVTGDFNRDGKMDIYAVQNSYAANPVVGHFDGGLSQLLLGDGQGHFIPVTPIESGLVVPGDAKGLATLDVNGDGSAGFIVTRNGATSLAFQDQRIVGGSPLCVGLRGARGNPTAIGARVTLELSDGTTESSEVLAGSGYYTQSSASCFFGYAKGIQPLRLKVRWPSGRETEQLVSVGTTHVVISEDAP